MKRVVLVIYSLGAGGAERVMSTMANHWASEGREVVLLTLDHDTNPPFYELHPAVNHRSLGVAGDSTGPWSTFINSLRRIRALRNAIKAAKPDAVIAFMGSVNVLTLLAGWGLGIPLIVSVRNDPRVSDLGILTRVLRRFCYRKAAAVVCQSAAARSFFGSRIPGVVIPNPVPVPMAMEGVRRGERDGCGTVFAMGRLEEQKGFDLLIHAFSGLAAHHPGWNLEIWGEGSDRGALEAQIREAGMQGRIRLPGLTRHPAIEFQRADLFVLSSRFEGFPNVLCEAMAAGLPVIAFDCPSGPAEIIRDGIDGVLVKAGDSGELRQTMDRLMSSKTERKRLASRAPEVVRRFAVATVMQQWLALVENAMRSGRTKGVCECDVSDEHART